VKPSCGCRPATAPTACIHGLLSIVLLYVAHLQGLSEHSSLTSLSVAWNRMGAGGLEHISDLVHTLPTLSALDVSAAGMGPDGLAALAPAITAMTAVTSLNLSHNPGGRVLLHLQSGRA
jgi:hypothetical protein